MRASSWIAVAAVVVAPLWGCGGVARGRSTTPVAMEPVRVTATRTPEGDVSIEAYDARDLLRIGNEALSAEQWGDALRAYDRLVAEFPGSDLGIAAHYNAALALERRGELGPAADRYLRLVEAFPESPDAIDALMQAATCYERLERFDDAATVLDRALDLDTLPAHIRLEALARGGAARARAGRLDEAEVMLRRAVAFARAEGEVALRTDYYLAQAQHFLGEVPRLRMARIELSNDERVFRTALEARCELLLRAQTQYVQAIRIGNAQWAAASAYRIGDMYSSLYSEIMDVPVPEADVPAEITEPEEVAVFRREYPEQYRRLLHEYLNPLLSNAIRWWETNLMMVERTGVQGEWVARTRGDLQRVRDLLDRIHQETSPEDTSPEGAPEPGSTPSEEHTGTG